MAGSTPQETDHLVEQAISGENVEALLDLFEPDAVFIDPASGTELRGRDQIRDAVLEMLESKPRIIPGPPPTVVISGDIALVLSQWTMEAAGPDGEVFRQSGTATDVMRRQADGTWRYVIDNPGGVAQP
ncbi:MAG TPA: SgcJ/EcaC family oxidoreductase [Acidimicrobiales bacterium]|nr:SgcJ/EcaC family oxidoreductase [Acidimicrobiales bacterium]